MIPEPASRFVFRFPSLRLCAALVLLLAGWTAQAASGKPNIILILADDLGYGEVGCYGQEKIRTPNIDRMAREGMRFTQFYAGSTVCAPSRSVLMTGKHLGHTTVRGNAPRSNRTPQTLRDEDVTVAEVLKEAGYATALIGKWGLGMPGDEGHPNRQGFDYFYGYLSQFHAHNHYPDHLWRNEERIALANDIVPVGDEGAGYSTNRAQYAGDLFAKEALDYLERSGEQPFFLFLSLVAPHANNERANALGNGAEVPDLGPYKNKDWSEQLKGHAAMITRMDDYVGQVLAKLKALGIEDDTLVIFTSDNGPHKESRQDANFFDPNGPFRGMKRDLYEGGIRVPFIARWPGTIKTGVTGHVAYFGDFMATFAQFANAQLPPEIDSISFAPTLWSNPGQEKHPFLYWEFHEAGFSQAVLLDGRYKGIRTKRLDNPVQLYDLKNDPGEGSDISSSHPDLVREIKTLFTEARTDSPLWPIREAAPAGGRK